jgi:DNA (cytosine-5)-methyltransferase 1
MAQHSESGRVVIELDPALKRRLHASLALSGLTLKDWFVRSAETLCASNPQLVFNGKDKHLPAPKPRTKGKQKSEKKPYTVISMFSGCGGMDLGFVGGFEIFGRRYRSLPFEVIWANDFNKEACVTYEKNLHPCVHHGDVWQLLDKMPKKADVIVGGFPCQDISVNGKRAGVNASRSGLYRAMVEAIKNIKPKVFVAENVKALLKHEEWLNQVFSDFSKLGYNVHCELYRAADYGVPQTRERVFFVGTAPSVPPFKMPVPERDAGTWMTAKEAIGDLEKLPENPALNHIWSRANISPEQGNRRLVSDRAGYTIRAECHGNIQFHYSKPRRISMREAARIQSFPDRFLFSCGIREMERQIGNAVPPILAWHVARAVQECLDEAKSR